MKHPDIVDITARSERGRNALLEATARVPDDVFTFDPSEDDWRASRNLRHVAWVEYFWTLAAARASEAPGDTFDLDRDVSQQMAVEASRRAGTPEQVLPKPPPYATKEEAVSGLEESRRCFLDAIESMTLANLQKPIAAPWGELTVRWALEHIVEHDWDHAVQITAIGR